MPLNMKYQSKPYYHYLDIDDDKYAIFDILEGTLESAQDFASEHSLADEQNDNNGSSMCLNL